MASLLSRNRRSRDTLPSRRGLVDVAGPAAEPFRTLRLALELRPETRRGKTIVFTSPNLGDGKSTVAANYALIASLSQQRVLLIDSDLRHPVLHELFQVPRGPGLIDVLGKHKTMAECVRDVNFLGQVDLLTAGTPVPRVGDVMSSAAMSDLLDAAISTYDAVVLDTPPTLEASDAATLAARPDVDVALIVNGKGKRRPVLRALRKLELIDANVLGLVVNREGSLSTYGYGYTPS
ncbi:MAG: CpsD/CapB family tyrosine-protein kinase [Actinomycetota bacterium]